MSHANEILYKRFLKAFQDANSNIRPQEVHIIAAENWRKLKADKSLFPSNVETQILELQLKTKKKQASLHSFWVRFLPNILFCL